MNPLQTVLDELKELEQAVRADGAIAPANVWVDTYTPGGRKTSYARKRSDRALWDGKKTKGLGKVGGDAHLDFEQSIKRRKALEEITRRAVSLQAMLDNPIWEPEAEDMEEADSRPVIIRDRDFSLFRSRGEKKPWRWEGCGRFGGQNSGDQRFTSELAAERDAAKVLSAPSLTIDQSEYVPPQAKKTAPKQKKPVSYVCKVQPPRGRVHVYGGEMGPGKWNEAALCGERPSSKGWQLSGLADIDCGKCERRLKEYQESD